MAITRYNRERINDIVSAVWRNSEKGLIAYDAENYAPIHPADLAYYDRPFGVATEGGYAMYGLLHALKGLNSPTMEGLIALIERTRKPGPDMLRFGKHPQDMAVPNIREAKMLADILIPMEENFEADKLVKKLTAQPGMTREMFIERYGPVAMQAPKQERAAVDWNVVLPVMDRLEGRAEDVQRFVARGGVRRKAMHAPLKMTGQEARDELGAALGALLHALELQPDQLRAMNSYLAAAGRAALPPTVFELSGVRDILQGRHTDLTQGHMDGIVQLIEACCRETYHIKARAHAPVEWARFDRAVERAVAPMHSTKLRVSKLSELTASDSAKGR